MSSRRIVAKTQFSWAFFMDSVTFTRAVVDGLTSLGGSESSCMMLARALADRGHDVHIFTPKIEPDAEGRDARGVTWHLWDDFLPMNRFVEWDCVVSLRSLQPFMNHVSARYRMLWNQDLLIANTMQRSIMSVAWGLDRVAYVSGYHRKQWEGMQPELAPVGWATTNCYDPACVPDPKTVTKDPYRILHVSRPERGLAPLLAMWPALRAKEPRATLRICRYNSMYDTGPGSWTDRCAEFDRLVLDVNEAVGGITYLGELNKRDLYREYAEAAVVWYPGVVDFAETSCIAAIETQACETPFVGSFKGALPETAAPMHAAGLLIDGDSLKDRDYHERSITAVLRCLDGCARDSRWYRELQDAGRMHAKAFAAGKVAASWETMLDEAFDSRRRMHAPGILAQLMREDDHVAGLFLATDIASGNGHPSDDPRMGFTYGDATVKKAAEALALCKRVIAGKDQGPQDYSERAMDALQEAKGSGRYRVVVPMFANCTRVLDVACGNGSFAIALCWANPNVHVYGVDYSPANIEHAKAAAIEAGVANRCHFERVTVYDFDTQTTHSDFAGFVRFLTQPHEVWPEDEPYTPEAFAEFDGAFVGEFLEHVANAKALVDAVESGLKDGAVVVYTTPCGACTDILPRKVPLRRGHVHRFHREDVQALFGLKSNLSVDYSSWGPDFGVTPRGLAIGGWIISYWKNAENETGERDLPERIRRTRPMPRLTVGLIAHNAELELPVCLDSIWAIADEIVVGDCASTDTTAEIATSFGARVVALPSVQSQPEGFAGARNAVLREATGDWFLWIDTDERMIRPEQLRKYLDATVFHGYALHQKHLYLDMPPSYDTPIRLFRRLPSIQFYGCVHEQPQMGDCNGDITPSLEPFDLEIAHTGYLSETTRRYKMLHRNLPLLAKDQGVFPDRMLGKVLVLRDYVNLADYDREENRGAMTEKAQRAYFEAIRMFMAYFDDPANKFHKLARPFYEASLRALGTGWEFEIALAGKEHGLNGSHAGPQRAWVRDSGEMVRLMAYLTQKCAEGMAQTPTDVVPLATQNVATMYVDATKGWHPPMAAAYEIALQGNTEVRGEAMTA